MSQAFVLMASSVASHSYTPAPLRSNAGFKTLFSNDKLQTINYAEGIPSGQTANHKL
ncbi:MAG TPA: hypothetical protein VN958_16385 [Chitinophagaceae bacterium]|nr:hypothetical protein [Chitinophagaceae bacterium]